LKGAIIFLLVIYFEISGGDCIEIAKILGITKSKSQKSPKVLSHESYNLTGS
jgi:hypothetical protein